MEKRLRFVFNLGILAVEDRCPASKLPCFSSGDDIQSSQTVTTLSGDAYNIATETGSRQGGGRQSWARFSFRRGVVPTLQYCTKSPKGAQLAPSRRPRLARHRFEARPFLAAFLHPAAGWCGRGHGAKVGIGHKVPANGAKSRRPSQV